MSETVLITGASRGLGLEFARQYLADGWEVYATCRTPEKASALNRLAETAGEQLRVQPLEVTDEGQIHNLRAALGSHPVDVLINNAGTYGQKNGGFGMTDAAAWEQAMRVNVIAVMKMMEAFVDSVAASRLKIIVNVSSKMGSMADNGSGGSYVYRSSKAALNAVSVSAARDLNARGVTVVALHPGWVRTDMGGTNALIDAEESVAGMRRVISNLKSEDSGRFVDFKGQDVLW